MSILEFDPWLRINHALDVTKRMGDAKYINEMIAIFSDGFRFEIDKDKTFQYGGGRACDFIYDDCRIHREIPGGIDDKHKLEYLITELVVGYVYSAPSYGRKKDSGPPSFAFLLAGLSTLPSDDRVDENFRQIFRSAYNLTVDLAIAAIAASHADTLKELERGIRAVQELKPKSNLSMHVFACLMAHRHMIEGCVSPTKGSIRNDAINYLSKRDIRTFKDSARWREVFEIAGLKDLPPERPGRKKRIRDHLEVA